jgi:hypothetical protein
MASFAKKLKRKQFVMARKKFMKDFKKQVVCSKFDRAPAEGENIDDWHIDKYTNNIDLICTNCYNKEESEDLDAEDIIV